MHVFRCFLFLSFIGALVPGCNHKPNGERLAKQYCGSCHVFPEPALLDKTTWKKAVLPEMAFRMGLDYDKLFGVPHVEVAKIAATLPVAPMVSQEEWAAIQQYFLRNAPERLPLPEKTATDSITAFSFAKKSFPFYAEAFVTCLGIDAKRGKVLMGDKYGALYQFDQKFNLEAYTRLKSAPSQIAVENDHLVISLMGIMEPNDQERGDLVRLDSAFSEGFSLIDSLQRPVCFSTADLNNDGERDYIIGAYGNFTGQLLVFEKRKEAFIKHMVSPSPGTRKVIVKDVDHDGLEDMVVLMAQGNEKITLFLNKGDFKFEEKLLLRFPPVYGSSYLEIADFNQDGFFDILYTNGDNADFSTVLKPYHGVKLYLNDGALNFYEHWTYPMYGASEAKARDFDGDGDLDIVAIAFFPDFAQYPKESLLYFENLGANNFKAQTTALATSGRWLVMEAGDYDLDGDEDVLIGAHNLQVVGDEFMEHWKEEPVAILVMENQQN